MRYGLAIAVAALIIAGAYLVQDGTAAGRTLSFSLLCGAAFGVILQRSRFCFFCNVRDWLECGDARGVVAILVALAVGAVGYFVIFGAWMPVPAPERLPPTAHVGPVSAALAVAAFVFGVGMTISGSCISAHLYRLGEGSPTSPFALVGSALGFMLGFATWNPLYLATIAESPAIWLPHYLGYALTLAATLLTIAALTYLAVRRSGASPVAAAQPMTTQSAMHGIFINRWPPVIAGILVGAVSTAAYLRVSPLGVTAELGSLSRTAAAFAGLLPDTLYGLDGFRGCATMVKTVMLSNNGLFVLGLIGGSWAAALVAGQFQMTRPSLSHIGKGLLGGVLMGWAAMTALGCTVGSLLSGIHAGALSGWVFLVFCFAGVAATLAAQRMRSPVVA